MKDVKNKWGVEKMKVFITGAGGFVGRQLVSLLVGEGHEIVACDKVESNFSPPVENISVDVSDRESIGKALDDWMPDVIVSLAGLTFVPASHSDPFPTWNVNLFGPLAILEWIRTKKPDTFLLLVSSSEVYGKPENEAELPFTESSPLKPISIYGATKMAMDIAGQIYATNWGLKIAIARPFNHIGPGQSELFVVPAFAKQIAQIIKGKREPVVSVGNLSAMRDFTDTKDIIRAYSMIIRRQKTGVFNLCSGKAIRIDWILHKLAEIGGVSVDVKIDRDRLRPADIPIAYGSFERAKKELGWEPKIPIEQSLKEILNWWVEIL